MNEQESNGTHKKILAICGSTRTSSTNLNLIKAIAALSIGRYDIAVFNELATIPHFNPDLDNSEPPAAVAELRERIRSADGVLICTPEYAMGVPGSLKNAIDWMVSSCEFSHKPTALITASSVGQKGHASLMETLRIIEANVTGETQLVIPFAKTKIGEENKITDKKTLEEVTTLLDAFGRLMSLNIDVQSK